MKIIWYCLICNKSWNPSLALIAQNWSANCNFAHGQSINSSTLGNLGIGQNIFYSAPAPVPPVNISVGILAWFNEKADFTYNTNTCATGKVCGHYTQVSHSVCVWTHVLSRRRAQVKIKVTEGIESTHLQSEERGNNSTRLRVHRVALFTFNSRSNIMPINDGNWNSMNFCPKPLYSYQRPKHS